GSEPVCRDRSCSTQRPARRPALITARLMAAKIRTAMRQELTKRLLKRSHHEVAESLLNSSPLERLSRLEGQDDESEGADRDIGQPGGDERIQASGLTESTRARLQHVIEENDGRAIDQADVAARTSCQQPERSAGQSDDQTSERLRKLLIETN